MSLREQSLNASPFVPSFSPFFLGKQKEWAPGGIGKCFAEDDCQRWPCRAASAKLFDALYKNIYFFDRLNALLDKRTTGLII